MKRSMLFGLKALAVAILGVWMVTGCDQSSSPNAPRYELSAQDQAAIRRVIASDELFNNTGIDDDGAQNVEYSTDGPEALGKVAEQIDTKRWGRFGRLKFEKVEIEATSDTTATATVTYSLDGYFIIIARDTTKPNLIGAIYKKDMKNTLVHKAKLVKVDSTGNDRKDWRIVQVSGGVMSSPNPTIQITNFTIQFPDGSKLSIDDPLQYFWNRQQKRNRGDLPALAPRDTVKMYVTLTNSNNFPPEPGETVLMRYGMNHQFHRSRKLFRDDGIYPDAVAGDGVYSGYWIVSKRSGHHHGAVDVIDNGTIYDDSAPYDAVVWTLPYHVKF
ncbi:MAG: hypothetical protein ONB44_18135 [candidate division KSB1 bacterium]|nr:hypothetical protein [candidate division KSB1 bacterium]MDZ7304048.1 hypothetical protein [candidate division KSB1 bacterium]MDZ7313241.1 hypothetical protein [candidate division KSB1 bacterium]